MHENLSTLVEAVLKSAKYSGIHPALVERIGQQELNKRRTLKEAIKSTKNKLHQVGGAYLTQSFDLKRTQSWLALLQSSAAQPDALKQACRQIMAGHASTSERLPLLPDFYKTVLAGLPPIHSVIDVACGLNPLTIPWMPLAEDVHYQAYDIYADMIDFLNQALPILGIRGKAEQRDVIAAPPTQPTDLALVLKTIPCLEQVDSQAGELLLSQLNARHMLVSFPARSLGGRDKGMLQTYNQRFTALAEARQWQIQRFALKTELVYLVDKGDNRNGRPDTTP